MKLVAGIDIGGTNTRYGLVNKNGVCGNIESVLTKKFKTPEELVKEISMRIIAMAASNKLQGIGVGAPNGNFYKGTIESAPNLPWKGIIPLANLFKKEMNLPCIVSNDANVAAAGEMLFGSAKKINDFIFITLGTGLGSGIVVDRKLIYGQNSLAGELGHVIVRKNGRACECGRKGCLETYVSATGIKRTIENWLRSGKKSILKKNESAIHSAAIFSAAKKGDALAKKAFEFTGEILGHALANSAAYTSPEVFFLSGGLAGSKDLLFEPTRRHFEKNLLNIHKNKIKILPSGLKENEAAVLGAASLIWNLRKN